MSTLLLNIFSKEHTSASGGRELHLGCVSATPNGPGAVSKEAGTALLGAGDGLATEPLLATANEKGVRGCHEQRAEPQMVIQRYCEILFEGKKIHSSRKIHRSIYVSWCPEVSAYHLLEKNQK